MSTETMASVNIRCIPDNQYAVIGVTNTKRARIEIETKKIEDNVDTKRRNPINMVLILDRSGSMSSNNKLEFAKEAVIAVLNLLHDDDVVHLVAYDTKVWTVFENSPVSGREVLYSVVKGITTGGETFLSGGIETGANLLEKYPHPRFSKRMFVLSDGLANVGLKTKEEITKAVAKYSEKGIIIDSFGVGEDFDAAIMKGIAQAGCACGANLGDLHVDNLRVILCEFTVAETVSEGTEVEVVNYQLRYNLPGHVDNEPLVVTGQLSITFVNDESLIQSIDPKVKTLHAIQVSGEMDDRIAELIKNHRRDEAIALITEQIILLKEVEHLDDERGMVAMLIRLAENMEKRLKEQKVSAKAAAQKYGHHGHLKKCYDHKYAEYYDED
ncbi:unnamed protein product [Rotaria sp. Silwood2]|nr:unnamed protein product [Rotaria sp. Silwood2]